MTKRSKQKLSHDRPATYKIKVPGELDDSWFDWDGEIRISIDYDDDGLPFSTLTGLVDQATLLGLLRSLYSLGIPLVSVICVDVE